jgi:hypothetical protein
MYLALFNFAMVLTKEQRQILCRSRKKPNGDPGNDWTSIRGRRHEPYMENPNSPQTEKGRTSENNVNNILIIFFDVKEIVHKEFVLAG